MPKSFKNWLATREKAAERELLFGEQLRAGELLSGERLLEVLDIYLRTGRAPPPRLATVICNRLESYYVHDAKTLDEAIGLSRTGEQIETQRRYHSLVIPITWHIVKRKRARQQSGKRKRAHKGIADSKYEDIANGLRRARPKGGEGFYITASTVKDIYNRGRKELPWLEALFESLL